MQFTREVYNGGPHWKVARKAAQLFRFFLSLEIPSCNSVEFTVENQNYKLFINITERKCGKVVFIVFIISKISRSGYPYHSGH